MRSTRSAARKGHGPPLAVGRLGVDALAPRRAAMTAHHIGLGPGLVDEDEACRVKLALMLPPADAAAGDVGPVLLAGVHGFF